MENNKKNQTTITIISALLLVITVIIVILDYTFLSYAINIIIIVASIVLLSKSIKYYKTVKNIPAEKKKVIANLILNIITILISTILFLNIVFGGFAIIELFHGARNLH